MLKDVESKKKMLGVPQLVFPLPPKIDFRYLFFKREGTIKERFPWVGYRVMSDFSYNIIPESEQGTGV